MMKKLPVYEAILSDSTDGVTMISLVGKPANQRNFIAMSTAPVVHLAANKMKQELVGAVLIPDQLIYRVADDGTEYNLTFTASIIEEMYRGFHANTGNLKLTNIEHSDNTVTGVVLNSYILNADNRLEADKLGFSDLPDGTWMVKYWIPKTEDWNKYVMSGEVKGFSIEAFLDTVVKMKMVKRSLDEVLTMLLAAQDVTEDMLIDALKMMDEDGAE